MVLLYTPPPYVETYIQSEVPGPNLAVLVKKSLQGIPETDVMDEIYYASKAFGLDPCFMFSIAQIESDFQPKSRTGKYKGLFQLSDYEFKIYGTGNIYDARDNAIAAAYKITVENYYFQHSSGHFPTLDEMYLIHQQGEWGALEHEKDPERLAWLSMCATPEGHEKGEKWCKRAIWGNTLPAVKDEVKDVEHFTSSRFVQMWRYRVAVQYLRYKLADPYNGYNGPWR